MNQNRHENHGYRDQGDSPRKEPQIVKGTRNDALKILRITPEEQVAFTLYLNYAVNNICDVAKIDVTDEHKVYGALYSVGKNEDPNVVVNGRLQKLANFLWSFKRDDPSAEDRGFKRELGSGQDDLAVWLTEEIFALRNFFAHVNRKDCQPLIIDQSHYVFIEGILGAEAREGIMGPGLNPAKAQKLKLVTNHIRDDHSYEFTRKGLIFLVCLALYKDEAEEFCHLFSEMKVQDSVDNADLEEDFGDGRRRRVIGKKMFDELKGEKGKGRALIELFTYYSYRRGRQSLDAENLDFMSFADIIGDLNKPPVPSYEYLSLGAERKALAEEAAVSTESEKNKRFKYDLHRRDRDRFLPLAVGFCEDFGILPSIRFKRLDVREISGRHKYIFGGDQDEGTSDESGNRVRLNRHYAMHNDSVAFEFVPPPESHYGPIHIKALRSSVSATELRKLLYAKAKGMNPDEAVRRYFTAYHRVLERMVNADSLAEICLTDDTYASDFAVICGTTPEALRADPENFRPYVMESLRRYFTNENGVLSDEELLDKLVMRLRAGYDRAYDTLTRFAALAAWRVKNMPWLDMCDRWREAVDEFRDKHQGDHLPQYLLSAENYSASKVPPTVRPPEPCCKIGDGEGEVSNPPSRCRFSDADLVGYVFDYFNLFLPADRKFRQLPIAEQHRPGIEDHLYQMVHAAIGKFSLDQKGLWSLVEKYRGAELAQPIADLKRKIKDEEKNLRPKNGKRQSATLEMLAIAAVQLTRDLYNGLLDKWEVATVDSVSGSELKAACRRFGVKLGMPLERKSLIKSVLGIDFDSWRHAYDYESGRPYENRTLEGTEHIVSQIPLPNGFTDRIIESKRGDRHFSQWFKTKHEGAEAVFDFNAAFREWKPDDRIFLRDFYDVKPLVDSVMLKKKMAGGNVDGGNVDACSPLSRKMLDSVIREIKNYENQDKVLLYIAMEYRKRFQADNTFAGGNAQLPIKDAASLKDLYNVECVREFGKIKVRYHLNDVNRPIFATICGKGKDASDRRTKLAAILSNGGDGGEFDFYDMVSAFREQKARDRHARLEFMPYVMNFEAKVDIPHSAYAGIKGDAVRAMEFERYKAAMPSLAREEYDAVADARNEVFHNGFRLDCSKAIGICSRLGISAHIPGAAAPQNHRTHGHGGDFHRRDDRPRW